MLVASPHKWLKIKGRVSNALDFSGNRQSSDTAFLHFLECLLPQLDQSVLLLGVNDDGVAADHGAGVDGDLCAGGSEGLGFVGSEHLDAETIVDLADVTNNLAFPINRFKVRLPAPL